MSKKQYKSVSAMVEGISQDPKFANKTLVKINEKQASQILKLTKEVERLKKLAERARMWERSHKAASNEANKVAKALAAMVKTWLTCYYGPKCGEFEIECICCQVWQAYEKIFDLD